MATKLIIAWPGQAIFMLYRTATSKIWSNDGLGVYYLSVDDVSVMPINGPHNRYYAYPLRCLSTALEGKIEAWHFCRAIACYIERC